MMEDALRIWRMYFDGHTNGAIYVLVEMHAAHSRESDFARRECQESSFLISGL